MLTAISNFYPRSINDVAKTLLDLNKTLQNSHMYISKPSNYYSECPNSHVLVVGKHTPPTPCFSRAILTVLRQLERDATQSASQWLITNDYYKLAASTTPASNTQSGYKGPASTCIIIYALNKYFNQLFNFLQSASLAKKTSKNNARWTSSHKHRQMNIVR